MGPFWDRGARGLELVRFGLVSRWLVFRIAAALSAVLFTLATVSATSAPALASGWSIQSTPTLAGPPQRTLSSVSCTAATACTAVGEYVDEAGGRVTMANRWNGSAWATQATLNPAGAVGSNLSGVSCTTASACTVVGYYVNSSTVDVALAEQWNGTTWTIQTIAIPFDSTSSALAGVSCTSANACTAVGNYLTAAPPEMTFAEQWNGTSWTVQTTPDTGVANYALAGVSCTSASACAAVGVGDAATLAEQWNGSNWSLQPTSAPSGATSSALSGVSCTAADACTAVGQYINSAGVQQALAERYSG